MRQYIVNLTNHLIGKNHYKAVFCEIDDQDKFVQFVKLDLVSGDVQDMSPGTLGKIMCSFEIGNVMASKEELCNNITFAGDCDEMLRDLVSICLAYAIRDRLDTHHLMMSVPTGKEQSGFWSSIKKIKNAMAAYNDRV